MIALESRREKAQCARDDVDGRTFSAIDFGNDSQLVVRRPVLFRFKVVLNALCIRILDVPGN